MLVVAFVLAGVAAAAPRHYACRNLPARAKLRCAYGALHQARSGERWIRNHGGSAGNHSLGYWRWRERVALRWIRSASYRISHPPLAHLQLWVCFHNHEGAWDDDTGNGYFGGLQMTADWGPYGHPLVWHANLLSPYGQMSVAEHGYRIVIQRQGYMYARYTWLPGQWNHPDCFRYA